MSGPGGGEGGSAAPVRARDPGAAARAVLSIDRTLCAAAAFTADVTLLGWRTLVSLATLRCDSSRAFREIDRQVIAAAPLILLTGLATGGVMVWQMDEALARFGASVYSARIVALSLVRELAPVLVGLLMAARAGSATAAELASMATTEQLAAMRALALDWQRHLVSPRVVALAAGVPCLVLLFDIAGLTGGFLVGVLDRGIPYGAYLDATIDGLRQRDLAGGLIKGAVFGLLIALISCRQGLMTRADGGAGAVGSSTTVAVVSASVSVLLSDAVLTRLLLHGPGGG